MKHARSHTPAGQVVVRVKGKNLTVTPALRDHVVQKMRRLDKYFDRLSDIEVELSSEQTRQAEHHHHVEATTRVLGRVIRVTTMSADTYAAIDDAVDKLYRQLNRHKERIKAHHGSRAELDIPLETEQEEDEGPEPIVHSEPLRMKPMFEEEALAELAAQNAPFYVFLNARTEQVNVLYGRDDGSFALVEPAIG